MAGTAIVRLHVALVLAVLIGGLFGCVPAGARAPSTPSFDPCPCWFVSPPGITARCGTVRVPESRGNRSGGGRGGSGVVRLAVAVFSKPGAPSRGPLFFLSGGPGDAAIDPVIRRFTPAFAAFVDQRDLVVIDQRGTGRSEPSLDCPVHDVVSCRARLLQRGIDLGAYTTAENAADINDARLALGYAHIDLLGASYGTLLAQAVMRDFPAAVRSAVLDSPAPLQDRVQLELLTHFEPALQVLFAACESDHACGSHYPGLRARFDELVARLNAAPIRIPLSGGADDVTLSGGRFAFLIWQSLYFTEAIPYLPRVIAETAAGRYERLARLIERERLPDEQSEGMQNTVECAEMAPFMTFEQLAAAARNISPLLRRVALQEFGDVFARCRTWNVPAASSRQKEPLRSTIPVLLLSGAFDPATPPASARRTAATLPHAQLVVFPGSGHGVFRTEACARELVAAFLAAPEKPLQVSCRHGLSGPVFAAPE